jgi:hypothetical protein
MLPKAPEGPGIEGGAHVGTLTRHGLTYSPLAFKLRHDMCRLERLARQRAGSFLDRQAISTFPWSEVLAEELLGVPAFAGTDSQRTIKT